MSGRTHTMHRATPGSAAERHRRWAWVFVALTIPAFVGAMFLGEGLLTAAGYSAEETVPLGVALRAGGPAVLLIIAPTVGAVWFGLRARREGSPTGWVPALVGAVIAAATVVSNVAGYVAGRLAG